MESPKLKLRIYGDSCLRKRSASVAEAGPSERILIKIMLETMYENKGVGLAAPQVGINRRIFVMDAGEGPLAVINPKVLKSSGAQWLEEGCLSLPGVSVNVKRPQKIIVSYMDQENQPVKRELSDMMARVFLHESDHLNGKLICDYAGLYKKLRVGKLLKDMNSRTKEA